MFIIADVPGDEVGVCTGTIVDDDELWIVTAAHCVEAPPAGTYICAMSNNWNYDSDALCAPASEIIVNPDYNPSVLDPKDWSDDSALMKTDHCGIFVGCDWPHMNLSAASDAEIESYNLYNLGLPGFAPGCSTNFAPNADDDPSFLFGRNLFLHWAAVTSTPGKRIYSHHDGGPGQSGSPLFHCPGGDGVCNSGEIGVIDGIWAGYDTVQTTRVSAKVPDFRSWAVGIID